MLQQQIVAMSVLVVDFVAIPEMRLALLRLRLKALFMRPSRRLVARQMHLSLIRRRHHGNTIAPELATAEVALKVLLVIIDGECTARYGVRLIDRVHFLRLARLD